MEMVESRTIESWGARSASSLRPAGGAGRQSAAASQPVGGGLAASVSWADGKAAGKVYDQRGPEWEWTRASGSGRGRPCHSRQSPTVVHREHRYEAERDEAL